MHAWPVSLDSAHLLQLIAFSNPKTGRDPDISYFSHRCDKIREKSNLRKGRKKEERKGQRVGGMEGGRREGGGRVFSGSQLEGAVTMAGNA